MNERRIECLRARLENSGLDGVVLFPSSSFAYFSGFTPRMSERFVAMIIGSSGVPTLVAPLVEAKYVAERTSVPQVVPYSEGDRPEKAFKHGLGKARVQTEHLGVEHRFTRLFELDVVKAASSETQWYNADPVTIELRMQKEPQEIALLRIAVLIAEKAIKKGINAIHPDVKESDVAKVMRTVIENEGGRCYIASAISGTQTAFPHASPSDRVIQRGDLVSVAVVLEYRGYYADLTRPVGIPPLPEAAKKVLLEAHTVQDAAVQALRSGCTAAEIDRAARTLGTALGYLILHRTGHGIGLDVHEPPYLSESDTTRLLPGTVMTIEPGLYVPGVGGARYEDEFVIDEKGNVEALSHLSKDGLLASS